MSDIHDDDILERKKIVHFFIKTALPAFSVQVTQKGPPPPPTTPFKAVRV